MALSTGHKVSIGTLIALLITTAPIAGGFMAWGKINQRLDTFESTIDKKIDQAIVDTKINDLGRRVSGMEPVLKEAYDVSHKNDVRLDNAEKQLSAIWRRIGN